MARTRELVLGRLEANREPLKRFGVKSLGLFGSVARGEATASSDLDFVVELERNTFDAYMGLKEFLEGLFDCRVDLVLAHTLKPRLREPVLRETVHAQGL